MCFLCRMDVKEYAKMRNGDRKEGGIKKEENNGA